MYTRAGKLFFHEAGRGKAKNLQGRAIYQLIEFIWFSLCRAGILAVFGPFF